uniref:Uncharacterized protein n=1 Tax=Setaria italica TaxID=4555 RepID=K3ZBU0_SETIT
MACLSASEPLRRSKHAMIHRNSTDYLFKINSLAYLGRGKREMCIANVRQ